MPRSGEIESLIEELSSSDPLVRGNAAEEIFQRGRELAEAVFRDWAKDGELKDCFVLTAGGLPILTVGIAIDPELFESVRNANGSPRLANAPPDQDAKEFELHLAGARLDILTTRAPDGAGAIARFLQKRGAGIQQVEIIVNGVDRATEILRKRFGVAPAYPSTRAGADGTRVNFFLVPTGESKRVLIELVEPAPLDSA